MEVALQFFFNEKFVVYLLTWKGIWNVLFTSEGRADVQDEEEQYWLPEKHSETQLDPSTSCSVLDLPAFLAI